MKRTRKVVSAAALSAILAAQAVMSVAAADGSINVDMSTKSPILRVNVPTKMAVSVNEFEMGDAGSQITSAAFTMKNLSEIPVTVKVSSEATVDAATALVSTKQAAVDSTDTTNPAMWLAAVAAVADNSGTLEYATGTDKTVAGLAGTEANISAFGAKDANNKSTVNQTFYLQAATAAAYKGITGTDVDAAKTDIGGADFYQLTEISGVTDAAGAAAEAATRDIYMGTAPTAGTPSTLTKIEKGTAATGITFAGKVYDIAAAPTASSDLVNTNMYLYIDSATTATGDAAAFRYIGALSGAKSGWSTTDLSAITIAYDITAISAAAYTEVAKADGTGLTYGYKAGEAEEEARITVDATGLMTLNGVNKDNWKGGVVVLNGTEYAIGGASGSWVDAESDPATFQFASAWVTNIKGKQITVKVTLQDDSVIEETITVPES